MTYKAFVSSTFIDLQKHREHVNKSLRKTGFFVDPMEDWTATSDEPKTFSQARLEGCDICVLIVGFRRGFIPDGEIFSITQLEYRAARKRGIDILVFMLDGDAPWPRKYDELEKDPEVKKWRSELLNQHGVSFFGLEPASIDIASALTRWLAEKTTKNGTTYQDYDFILGTQPDLFDMEKECRTENTGRAMRELREMIKFRLQSLAKKNSRDETGEPPMEVLRRLGAVGIITTEALRSLEYALTVTSETLYEKEVEREEAVSAVREAAVGFYMMNLSDTESPQFQVIAHPRDHFSFVLSIDRKGLISSPIFSSKQAVLGGIRAVRRAAERKWGIQERDRYIELIGPNGERLGKSPTYASLLEMENARDAVVRFAPTAPIVMPD